MRRAGAGRPRPSERGARCGAAAEVQRGGARKVGEAIPRGESGLCDPRRPDYHRRICAPDICRPSASLAAAASAARVRAETTFPPHGVGRGRPVPAQRVSGSAHSRPGLKTRAPQTVGVGGPEGISTRHSPRRRAQRGYEPRRLSRPAEWGRGRRVPARRVSGSKRVIQGSSSEDQRRATFVRRPQPSGKSRKRRNIQPLELGVGS